MVRWKTLSKQNNRHSMSDTECLQLPKRNISRVANFSLCFIIFSFSFSLFVVMIWRRSDEFESFPQRICFFYFFLALKQQKFSSLLNLQLTDANLIQAQGKCTQKEMIGNETFVCYVIFVILFSTFALTGFLDIYRHRSIPKLL